MSAGTIICKILAMNTTKNVKCAKKALYSIMISNLDQIKGYFFGDLSYKIYLQH